MAVTCAHHVFLAQNVDGEVWALERLAEHLGQDWDAVWQRICKRCAIHSWTQRLCVQPSSTCLQWLVLFGDTSISSLAGLEVAICAEQATCDLTDLWQSFLGPPCCLPCSTALTFAAGAPHMADACAKLPTHVPLQTPSFRRRAASESNSNTLQQHASKHGTFGAAGGTLPPARPASGSTFEVRGNLLRVWPNIVFDGGHRP